MKRPPAIPRAPEPSPAIAAQEEAIRVAERLTALLESRRSASANAAPPAEVAPFAITKPPNAERAQAGADGVVGARHSGRLLGNLLLTRGFIVESELRYALSRQATTGGPIGEILVELGLITDRDLVELLAEQMRMPVTELSRVDCDRDLLDRVPKADARRLGALPLRREGGQVEVAIGDPGDENAVAELTRLLGKQLRLFLATKSDIDAAIERVYG